MTVWPRRRFLRHAMSGAAAAWSAQAAPGAGTWAGAGSTGLTGTLHDVEHIVVLTQENRSFDHYFGGLRGVRGWGDRFPIPVAGAPGRTVWQQPRPESAGAHWVLPFHLDTQRNFALMRAEGTPHTWPDAQNAWDQGRMGAWTLAKGAHAMGYYTRADLPLMYALADAYTVCDAYHCSFQGGTNTNRLFLWTGTNDPRAAAGGPALYNDLDTLTAKDGVPAYRWTTYAQRLQAAGVSWQVYQDMADNFEDNPLVGFDAFRKAAAAADPQDPLVRRALSTRTLEQLRDDVALQRLPQVCWIVAGAAQSEHPEPSSPAQGGHFTARVLEALASNPVVWNRTVVILNYDENDGYFDHVPPPAVPARRAEGAGQASLAGSSNVPTDGEYHEQLPTYLRSPHELGLLQRPYGLGPRVPLVLISPWSRGGWVCSEVFDHTSVLRFIARRFGVDEPQISAWRRAVCGDLTGAFDFVHPDFSPLPLWPDVGREAQRAAALIQRTLAHPPRSAKMPRQEPGVRPARALPYVLRAHSQVIPQDRCIELTFFNSGTAGAVLHVYDRIDLEQLPRRYTLAAASTLRDRWPVHGRAGAYDLWVLGPNGAHQQFSGSLPQTQQTAQPELTLDLDCAKACIRLHLFNQGDTACVAELASAAYPYRRVQRVPVPAHSEVTHTLPVRRSQGWYDTTVRVRSLPGFLRRVAGHLETGAASISDPLMGK